MKNSIRELRAFLILWPTQALSQLGSAMTSFALTLWLYERTGSALRTALLSVCSYGPYVVMSVFAGALSDRWDKKRTMLWCDALAACCTLAVLAGLRTDLLRPWHLYLLNAVSGLMNTVQQPAGEVAMTAIVPPRHYQRVSGLRSMSGSLVTVLHPVLATGLYALGGMEAVICVDLATFLLAFLALWLGVSIPAASVGEREPILASARAGLVFLRQNGLILTLILFLAGVNLVASAFDAVLPALILPRENGGRAALGAVISCGGLAMLGGSLLAAALPPPRDRVRVIFWTLLVSLGVENYLLAFGRTPFWWCLGQVIGFGLVPLMNANLDVILRSSIPLPMQGRVYACRNTLQFFTIPLGYFLGGALVDGVCEPVMARAPAAGPLAALFGTGKGSGAAMVMCLLGLAGTAVCLYFRRRLRKYTYKDPPV